MNLHENILRHGEISDFPLTKTLTAGKISLDFENGSLRYLRLGKLEIVRNIYSAVRDKEWLTVPCEISNLKIHEGDDCFEIYYDAEYKQNDIQVKAFYKITGYKNNRITFSMHAEALSDFLKNRLGFCLLTPLENFTGNPVVIIQPDGSEVECEFPRLISPHQPFSQIAQMRWEMPGGHKISVKFEGDLFEAEDHRNWTDASFKIYCTLLSKPYPAEVKKGDVFTQSIDLEIDTNSNESDFAADENVIIELLEEKPNQSVQIGIGKSFYERSLSSHEVEILRNLNFSHYRVEIYLFRSDWSKRWEDSVLESNQLSFPLECVLFFSSNYKIEIDDFLNFCKKGEVNISHFHLYSNESHTPPDEMLEFIVPLIKSTIPNVKVGSGTNANFVQLNRKRPESQYIDFISYSIHPQEHASDIKTIVENIGSQEYTVSTAMSFSNHLPILVSPVTMQRRFNPNIEIIENKVNGKVPPQIDPRQMSLFVAGWTVGSLNQLVHSGAQSLTYYETIGERGLMQGDTKTQYEGFFHSEANMIFPVFWIFYEVLKNKNAFWIKSITSQPLKIQCFAMRQNDKNFVWIANVSNDVQSVKSPFSAFKIRHLSAETLRQITNPISWENLPYKRTGNYSLIEIQPFELCWVCED